MVEHLTTLLDRTTVVPAVNQIEVHPYTQGTADHHELTGGLLTILPPGITTIGVAAEADTQRLAGLGAATVRAGKAGPTV